jgi:hypothetical protein
MDPTATTTRLLGVEDADPATDSGREVLLAAAVADGRLVEKSLPTWRTAFKHNPAKAATELSTLARPGDVGMDRLFPGQGA